MTWKQKNKKTKNLVIMKKKNINKMKMMMKIQNNKYMINF